MHARATHNGICPIPGIIAGKAEELRRGPEVGPGDEVQFVRAKRVGVGQTINAVVFKIKIARSGMKSEARWIANTGSDSL